MSNAATPPVPVTVTTVGTVAGAAWLEPTAAGVELQVVAKLVLQLGRNGDTSMISRPERPGWNQGRAAPEETEPAPARRVIVRGHRIHPGRVILRRGADTLAEVSFEPGIQTVIVPLSSTLQNTIGGRRDDDWLVVEGVEGPSTRRWCKLPKLGVVATWNEIERLLLGSKAFLVDVSNWTIAFVSRGSRKLVGAMAPRQITIALVEYTAASGTPPPRPAVAAPPPASSSAADDPPTLAARVAPTRSGADLKLPPLEDEPSSVGRSGRTKQLHGDELQKLLLAQQALEDNLDEGPTKVLPTVDLERLRGTLRESGNPAPAAAAAPAPATAARDGAMARPPLDAPEPGEVTRAFSAIAAPAVLSPSLSGTLASSGTPSASGDVTRAFAAVAGPAAPLDVRAELERRLERGLSLAGLDLTSARLAGISLRNSTLVDLDLSQVDLSNADLEGADLTLSRLDGANLDGAKLDGANLSLASLQFATLRGASLRRAMVSQASFAGADLEGADIRGAHPEAALVGANLSAARRS